MTDIEDFNVQKLSKNIFAGCATELYSSTYNKIYCYPVGYKSDDNVTKKLVIRFNDPTYCPFGITKKHVVTHCGNPMTSRFIQLNLGENVEKFVKLDEFILNYGYENRIEMFGEKFKDCSLEEFKKLYFGLVKNPKCPEFPNFIKPNIKENVGGNPDIFAYPRHVKGRIPVTTWKVCESYIQSRSRIMGDVEFYLWYTKHNPMFGVTCLLTNLIV